MAVFYKCFGAYSFVGGQPPYVTQPPNPPYPTYSTPGEPQLADKTQPPYPTNYPTSYPGQPQPAYYQGPAAGYNQAPSYGSPYQPTTDPVAASAYGAGSGYHDDEQGIVGMAPNSDWAGSSFSDKKIRNTFIKKVCHSRLLHHPCVIFTAHQLRKAQ